MNFLSLFLFSGFIHSAMAAPITFVATCAIDQPKVEIVLENDPRQIIECVEKAGRESNSFYFVGKLKEELQIKIGSQAYLAPPGTQAYETGNTCNELNANITKNFGITFMSRETGALFHLYFLDGERINIYRNNLDYILYIYFFHNRAALPSVTDH